MKRVLVLGGGFAGISAVHTLAKDKKLEVILVDKNNHHIFQPLLYQVATASLNPGDISFPLRTLFVKNNNVSVLMGEVTHIYFELKEVIVSGQSISYDYLIMGLGSESNYFNNPEWKEYALELKTIDDAIQMRNKLLSLLEEKELHQDKSINIGIIGGGPTGVELAGSIGEFFQYTTEHEFKFINTKKANVYLIEKGPRVLAPFTEKQSQKVERYLADLGVSVLKNANILNIEEKKIIFEDQSLDLDLIVWTAGVKAKNIKEPLKVESDRAQRVICNPDLSLVKTPFVFAVGDQAAITNHPLPAVAPVAIQQGQCAASNIIAHIDGRPKKDFIYKDKGSLAVIGRKFAVAQIHGIHLDGLSAWLIWCFAHIMPLVTFRSRFIVLFEFAWSYYRFRKGVRIITHHK